MRKSVTKIGRKILRAVFRRVSVVIIPHDDGALSRFRVPWVLIVVLLGVWTWMSVWVVESSVRKAEYDRMEQTARRYEHEVTELRQTMAFLEEAEIQFKTLLSASNKEDFFKRLPTRAEDADMGDLSVDLDAIREEALRKVKEVADIRAYLEEERDKYRATPRGWPVVGGRITSSYGNRKHPVSGKKVFHRALDVGKRWRAPIVATADGIVTYAGERPGSGRVVVISHGYGYTTLYAHNKKNLVKVGQVVSRGDTVALMGASGYATGPHVHYEVWKDGRHRNPARYLDER